MRETSKSKNNEIYEFIRDYTIKNLYSPTIREIGSAIGLSSTSSVKYHIERLEKRGLIRLSPHGNKIALVGYELKKTNK